MPETSNNEPGDSAPLPIPKNSNEFIEQQLDERLKTLGALFNADIMAFNGPIYVGVDDVVRVVVEEIAARPEKKNSLLVVLTTSGGYIEVVQRIVDTLRHYFSHVSFAVPNFAFSAGTVLAMSGDEIYMDYYSRLGPITATTLALQGHHPAHYETWPVLRDRLGKRFPIENPRPVPLFSAQ